MNISWIRWSLLSIVKRKYKISIQRKGYQILVQDHNCTYHQSQVNISWLKMVPLGQRKDTGYRLAGLIGSSTEIIISVGIKAIQGTDMVEVGPLLAI